MPIDTTAQISLYLLAGIKFVLAAKTYGEAMAISEAQQLLRDTALFVNAFCARKASHEHALDHASLSYLFAAVCMIHAHKLGRRSSSRDVLKKWATHQADTTVTDDALRVRSEIVIA